MATQIGNYNYTLHLNPKEPRTADRRFTDYADTAEGVFRLGQLGDRVLKVLDLLKPNETLHNLSAKFNGMWTVTVFPRLVKVTRDAKDAILGLSARSVDAGAARRKYVSAVADVTDAVSSWGYASSMVLTCCKKTAQLGLSILKAADVVTFVGDVAGLQMNAEDFSKARRAAFEAAVQNKGVDDASVKIVQENLEQTRNYHLLKTIKATCSIAGFVLGLSLAASGLLIPGIALIAASISLSGTLFAMGASLYKEAMRHEPVKFFDDKHVQRVAN